MKPKPLMIQHVMPRCCVDDRRQVEAARPQHDRDQDEADRDLVADHLRRRADRREERVFRVRRPARQDDAVDAERRRREDVEQPDIDVGEPPRRAWNGTTAHTISATVKVMIGASRNSPRLADDGMMVSCRNTFSPSANDWSRPNGPTTFGPAPQRHRRPDLAIGIDDHRDRQHQRQRDDEDAADRRERPRGLVGHAEVGLEEGGHRALPIKLPRE